MRVNASPRRPPPNSYDKSKRENELRSPESPGVCFWFPRNGRPSHFGTAECLEAIGKRSFALVIGTC